MRQQPRAIYPSNAVLRRFCDQYKQQLNDSLGRNRIYHELQNKYQINRFGAIPHSFRVGFTHD